MMLSKQCPDGQPGSRRVHDRHLKERTMTYLANIERFADRIAPVAILIVGMLTAFATAGLGA